jgi:cytochrome b subunit of formate dehydrogenase
MDDDKVIKDRIDKEVERRLSEKLSELKSQIRKEVSEELQLEEQKEDAEGKKESKPESKYFIRFGWNFRIQHIVLLTSTIMLILTGVPLKFPKNSVSQFIIEFFGGSAEARSVHHFFALGLIFVGLYHLVYSFWSRQGRKDFYELLPGLKDFSDLFNQLKYYLGLRKEKVNYGRFSYVEKFDYWAVYWGLIMMVGTGLVMWLFQGRFEPIIFGEISLKFGPDIITNYVHAIAREMHSDEALLATLVIIGWHFYNVHLNPHKFPMSKVWLNGKISEKEIKEEHPLEYEAIKKEEREKESDKSVEKK